MQLLLQITEPLMEWALITTIILEVYKDHKIVTKPEAFLLTYF